MNKWLAQLVLVISSGILLLGCSEEGSLPKADKPDEFFGPLPEGLPVYVKIVEPYLSTSEESTGSTALFSYKSQETASGTGSQSEVFSAGSDLIVALNTVADSTGRSEFTLIVKNDSVYAVNHLNNELRLLTHFTTKVCDILPIDIIVESVDATNGDRVLITLHDERVYVVTADDGLTTNACQNADGKKRYYELPLDYQVDSSANEGDEINALQLVNESLARSKLIFGWVPGAPENNVPTDKIDYAYLGFDSESQYLTLYDKEQEVIWTQKRQLQAFDVVDLGQGQQSSRYVFNVRPLYEQFYLIQLGLDVFVVDSGSELLTKVQSESETILADKVLSLTAITNSEKTYVLRVVTGHDDQNLFIFDSNNLYRSAYLASAPIRNPSAETHIIHQNPVSFDSDAHLFRKAYFNFSQFDLIACASDDLACLAADDVEAQSWQFFTPCEEQYGCSTIVEVNDFCETQAEKLQTQSDQILCTPTDYQHLSELNDPANDASFLAHMQYADNYLRNLVFQLHNERLFITARMNHKDVFLAYDFNIDFSQPKSLRENVFFGKRASFVGMDAFIFSDNLFLTALQKSSIRSNECYKNGQKVTCQLDDLVKAGSVSICTGKDLADGVCNNQFIEYESKALFCTEAQLNDLSCSDANLSQIDDLAVESAEEDAKWLRLYDYPTGVDKMFLLAGSNVLAVENDILDEGRLFAPSLYSVDTVNGQKDSLIASLEGPVEAVVGGWLSKEPILGESEVFGHIDVIAEEIRQVGGTNAENESILESYLLEQTYEDSNSLIPEYIKAPKVAQRFF